MSKMLLASSSQPVDVTYTTSFLATLVSNHISQVEYSIIGQILKDKLLLVSVAIILLNLLIFKYKQIH